LALVRKVSEEDGFSSVKTASMDGIVPKPFSDVRREILKIWELFYAMVKVLLNVLLNIINNIYVNQRTNIFQVAFEGVVVGARNKKMHVLVLIRDEILNYIDCLHIASGARNLFKPIQSIQDNVNISFNF
jgi:hypothetical protein